MYQEEIFPQAVLVVLGENTVTVVADYVTGPAHGRNQLRRDLVAAIHGMAQEHGFDLKVMSEEELDEPSTE